MNHLLYMREQRFSTGTWSGRVLTGFTLLCGDCGRYSVVERDVVELGGSIFNARSCQDLACPYCGVKNSVSLDNNGRILEDVSSMGAES